MNFKMCGIAVASISNINRVIQGNSVIAVNGDEKVDLENTELLPESLQVITHLSENNSVKFMLLVTTCCIYKGTSYICLFNNCKEKCTFSTQPWVLRDQISQEILDGIVIFLCLSKITSQASRDPNSTPKTRTKQSFQRGVFQISRPFIFWLTCCSSSSKASI